ncbi:hypothetical protein Tco_0478923 [Tanacetum coccineum]
MFPEESGKVERYVGGLPDMIHGSVVASKPKTMQEATEMATKLMDKKSALLLNVKLRIRGNLTTTTKLNNNLPRDKMWLKLTPLGLVKGRSMLELFHCATGASCTTMGHVLNPGHYRSDFPELKNQNHGNQAKGTRARGMVYAFGGGETEQDINNIEDEIEA